FDLASFSFQVPICRLAAAKHTATDTRNSDRANVMVLAFMPSSSETGCDFVRILFPCGIWPQRSHTQLAALFELGARMLYIAPHNFLTGRHIMSFNSSRALQLLRLATDSQNTSFREGQGEAIRHIVEGRSRLLVVQKTGWGKSLVYF